MLLYRSFIISKKIFVSFFSLVVRAWLTSSLISFLSKTLSLHEVPPPWVKPSCAISADVSVLQRWTLKASRHTDRVNDWTNILISIFIYLSHLSINLSVYLCYYLSVYLAKSVYLCLPHLEASQVTLEHAGRGCVLCQSELVVGEVRAGVGHLEASCLFLQWAASFNNSIGFRCF